MWKHIRLIRKDISDSKILPDRLQIFAAAEKKYVLF